MITRRDLLRGVAGTAGLLGWPPGHASGEPPPETTRVRLGAVPSICLSPQYVAEDLLRAEGFTDVRYPPVSGGLPGAKEMGAGDADIAMNFAAPLVVALDSGTPIVVLAGVHVGCFELIATDRVRDDQGPEGEDGRRVRSGVCPARVPGEHGSAGGSRSAQGHHLGDPSVDRGQATPRRGQGRCVPRVSPGSPGLAREEGRSRGGEQCHRPALVPVLLLHGGGEPGIHRPASGRHQARAARDPEGG